eukprot:g1919.t1
MTQKTDFKLHGIVRKEATIALESCRPFPAFDRVAPSLSPDQFASFYCNYTSANLSDVLTFCREDLTGDWDTPAMLLGVSQLNTFNSQDIMEDKEINKESSKLERPIQAPEVTVTCHPTYDHPINIKKTTLRHKSRSTTRWKSLKRFITCQNKFSDSICSDDLYKRSHSSMLSADFYPNEHDGWIKTNQATPFDNFTQSTNSNECPSSIDGGTSLEGSSIRWNVIEKDKKEPTC